MADTKDPKASAPRPQKPIPNAMKFTLGGLAGMCATCFVQPFDVIKTRMQVSSSSGGQKDSSLQVASSIFKDQGIPGLYKGLSAGLLRQATYSTARLGMYSYLNGLYSAHVAPKPTVLASMGMGVIAGSIGAFVGTPAEVALIRMQADGRLPPAERRNYKNVFNALIRIVKEENVMALYRGCIPTTARGAVVNMTQLASYSQFKLLFNSLGLKEGIPLHISASMMSGFLTTLASMPLDMAKTRIQNMKNNEYSGTLDVLMKVAKQEGVLSLWKGMLPYFFRLGPHTVLTFVFLEQFTQFYSVHILGNDSKGSGI
ncbi:mitochondrial 2-oxoglutarate/malate carrier protein-like [Teleopsis dalmanni]|uniref:mitochondrial 2-oxoglutarate/malate carrier protein-like n=1 Tax=Teleopsis dalmanni TaxID=139649 RepID=UPI0018CD2759|nr:mitochondrial 2-oxoglutarate/malate carrier protein-like [Teleopsis dalmanni]